MTPKARAGGETTMREACLKVQQAEYVFGTGILAGQSDVGWVEGRRLDCELGPFCVPAVLGSQSGCCSQRGRLGYLRSA